MFDLFSDIFACRDNALTRLDPRIKIILASALILICITSETVIIPLFIFISSVLIMKAIRIPMRLLIMRFAAPFGMVLVLVVLQTFLTGKTTIWAWSFLGISFSATQEGLSRGIVLGSRVLGSVSVMFLLSSATPAYKIFHALRWFRIPESWVEIALLIYRYIFTLLDQTADTAAAQKVRLGYSNLRLSFASMGVLTGSVVTRSIDQAMRTHEAMTLRGYNGKFPFGPMYEVPRRQWILPAILLPILISIHVFTEWWLR